MDVLCQRVSKAMNNYMNAFKVSLATLIITLTLANSAYTDQTAQRATSDQGPVVQSIVSLTSSLRGQLVKCFTTL